MKGADLPVSIDPYHHLSHHHILLQPPWFTHCQCLSASSHLRVKRVTRETNWRIWFHTWNIAKVVVTGWWWTARGTGSRSLIGCTVTKSPCSFFISCGSQEAITEKPSMWHQAFWSERELQVLPHCKHLQGFPRGKAHAGPSELSIPDMIFWLYTLR